MKNFIEDTEEFTNGGVFSVEARLADDPELIRIKIISREGQGVTEIIYIKNDNDYSIPENVELFMMNYEREIFPTRWERFISATNQEGR